MSATKRPASVSILAFVYLAIGIFGFTAHFRELLVFQNDSEWVELTECLAIVAGAFLLRGQNWARWLALVWSGFHVILSIFHSVHEIIVHSFVCAVIAWLLFRPAAHRYFRRAKIESQ